MQELDQLIREKFDYYFTQIHTTFPAVVVEYDAATRRATVQPSLKRKAGNKEYVEFPLLIDVPVQYPGTKKFTIHFPLEKGDEVAVFFSERAIELWKATGMDKIEDPDPRRFSLPDAYCTPGLQPMEFIPAVAEKAFEIIHRTTWDGKIIDHFIMDEDQVDFVRLEKKDEKDSFHFHLDGDKIETTYVKDDKQVYHELIDADNIDMTWKKDDKEVYHSHLDDSQKQITWKKDETMVAQVTIDNAKIETLYKDISSAIMEDADIKVKYKEKAQVLMEDDHIKANTGKCAVDMTADVAKMNNSQWTLPR